MTLDAHNGSFEAQNGALEDLLTSWGRRFFIILITLMRGRIRIRIKVKS
jgi:hypothetical protein